MLIYLDIDGVMVPANSWRRLDFLEDGFLNFSKISTVALLRILSSEPSQIVLTTSHKHKYSPQQWVEIFKNRGITVSCIKSLPENINHLSRRQELLQWLEASDRDEEFLIIDDDKSLNDLPEKYKSRLVQTSASVGLTGYLADEALRIIQETRST